MSSITIGIITCMSILVNEIYSTAPLVEIEQGMLQGIILYDINGREFFSFRSIPYARKPVGALRFKAPQSPEAWHGILEAHEDLPICLQRDLSENIIGQEDCLYLNVHTPEISVENLKPVMFYIHGGGFVNGSGRHELYGPEFLITKDVLLVTINYRLGLFGFLNFDDHSVGVPGNAALKDQNMALRWVQKNIDKFGGNPNNVTIFGESSGGACVHLHMLSPMSQGLFHRVIAQSGTALNVWSKSLPNTGILAARKLGFETPNALETLHFLQNQTTEAIMKVQENCFPIVAIHEPSLIGYVVENQPLEPAFLTDTPKNLIDAGKFSNVPFMLGSTNAEAIAIEIFYLNQYKTAKFPLTKLIPYDLHTSGDEKVEIVDKVQMFYSIGELEPLIDVMSDAWFNFAVHKTIVGCAKQQKNNLYLYVFSADTKLNNIKYSQSATSRLKGASHIDDLSYLFKSKVTPEINLDSTERRAVERVITLWTNFAKFGDPNIGSTFNFTWDPVTESKMNYLDIGTYDLMRGTDPFNDRMIFWEELYQNYTQEGAIIGRTTNNAIPSDLFKTRYAYLLISVHIYLTLL